MVYISSRFMNLCHCFCLQTRSSFLSWVFPSPPAFSFCPSNTRATPIPPPAAGLFGHSMVGSVTGKSRVLSHRQAVLCLGQYCVWEALSLPG